jgi:hypothetical protein
MTRKTKKKITTGLIPVTRKKRTRTKRNMAAAIAGRTKAITAGAIIITGRNRDVVQKDAARKAAGAIMIPAAVTTPTVVAVHPVIAGVLPLWTATR